MQLQRPDDPDRTARWHARGLLDDEELRASARYRSALARMQHLTGRALVRLAVSTAARCRPHEIRIVAERGAKPRLSLPSEAGTWHFNVSHSGDMVACAIDRFALGVDVETTARNVDHRAIARAHFAPEEARWIGDKDPSCRHRFTVLWTLKEAFLKAVGTGISVPLDGITFFAVGPGRCRVRSRDLPDAGAWHCCFMPLERGYWISVCGRNAMQGVRVRWMDLG